MMKQIVIFSFLIMLVATQTTVIPKTQGCACSNLLSQADCSAKAGCQWTATTTNSTNSTNSTSSTNTSSTSTTSGGTCGTLVTQAITYTTYCGPLNSTVCASTIGCAWLNNTCQIFTGCTAYVNTTNALCQAISAQCTTDTTKCIPIAQCSTYTKSQQQCEGNVGSVQPYKCKWTASGTTGTCSEQTCKDAPTTYTTLKQCQSWISNCLSTGAGCDTALGTCSGYKVSDNCVGRIGSDGNCGTPTDATAANCVARSCSDAPKTAAYNTDTACVAFQPAKTCVTTQKGCVDSPLPLCSTFKKTDVCTDFKGSDGWCTDDTTANSITCRPLKCSDASFTTNDACKTAVKGLTTCITNGLVCTDALLTCEQYTDTNSNCLNYIGSNGKCKGTSSTDTAKASCAARVCKEASNTLKDDVSCGNYKSGCFTTGAGCTDVLLGCSSYTGTATTCAQYKGNDGNCFAPTTQTTDSACQAKQCSSADATFTTNTQCQSYSYLCYTNGQGCTTLATCEAAQLATTCSGNNSCSTVNNLCLGVSDCTNFKIQSQCYLNNQIYKPTGSTTSYSRKCQWSSGSCSNIACKDIATALSVTLSDLKDDATCKAKLDGCFFGGAAAGGCVDVNDDCTKYTGTLTTCQNYKGNQGKDQCINTSTNASTAASCVKKACSSAKTQSATAISQQSHCQAFQSTGCNFNGVDTCTDGDCATYFVTDCTTVTTAKDGSGKALSCVKDTTSGSNQCKNKTCADATPSGATVYNTDALCNQWLTGCVTDGTKCVEPTTTQCSTYKGTQDQCSKFSFKPSATTSQSCTKLTKVCQSFTTCAAHFIPSTLTSTNDKSLDCQLVVESTDSSNCIFDSTAGKCANPSTCDKYVTTLTGAPAQQYCYSLNIKNKSCWWTTGGTCAVVADCTAFTILSGTQDKDAAAQCQKLSPDDGATSCGFVAAANKCSARSCSDFGIGATKVGDCTAYLAACDGYSTLGLCYTLKTGCGDYTIDSTLYNNSLKKSQYCSSLIDKTSGTALKCTYDQKTDKCLAANDCTEVTFSTTTVPADSEKLDVCANAQDKAGKKCAFAAAGAACLVSTTNCDSYTPIGTTDPERQTNCQKFVNAAGETCNFKTGVSTCNDYTKPSALTVCSDYKTYQTTDADNLKYCSNLIAVSGGPKCGYSSTTTGSCKTFACSDLTSTTCANYSSLCFYSGISCIGIQATCAGYTIENNVTDKIAYCKQLTGTTGSKKCAYNSATSTTLCSDRACADLTTSDGYKTCNDYLSTCTYDGAKCVTSLDCTTITPTGTTDSDKAAFCNKLGDGKKCTYQTGGDKCVATNSDCTYTIATLPFAYAQAACSITQDQNGKKCGYSTGTKCEARSCVNAITSLSTQNCIDWFAGCELDSTNSCAAKNCNDAPATLGTDALCGSYKSGCLTTLKGCIAPEQPCSSYKGDATQCQSFTGNSIKCNNKNATPTVNDSCVDKTCADNTVALNNADCDTWYPSKCVWNGTKGCWDNTKNCADFQGTVDSCKIYKANDGPCSGTGLGTTLAACYSNNICTNAPTSTKTDADCKNWHPNCITNGFGCIPKTSKCTDIVDPTVCAASALGCSSTGNQCLTKPTLCSSFITASDCNNLLLAGATTVSCGWDATKTTLNCVNLTCELLPASLTTDSQCAAKLTLGACTTSGAGCVTKDFCSNYKTQAICTNAKSKDTQGSCTWENSTCRPIKCEDKAIGATDDICNTYLTGCRTNGVSCVTPSALGCSSLARQVCLKDGSGNPCYWFQNSCQQYVACTSLTFASHPTCQSYSPSCTTDGTKCIAIDKCASLQKASCFIGTDNGGSICGWGQITGQTGSQCQVFSNCAAFNGTTNVDCAAWGSKCITDGTKCVDTANCAAYQTQVACGNQGTDGRCQWVAATTGATGTCRLRQCTDATATDTTLTTFTGCQSYIINTSTKCNTDGKQCISLGACSSNIVQAACQSGTDGDCFWGLPLSSGTTTNSTNSTSSTSPTTVSSVCRLKVCTDLALTSSSSCSVAISKVDCVSDGTKCIPKATCSSYTTREACAGKGTDGLCAFTPTNTTTPTVGTCRVFSQCSDANSDSTACNSNPSCNFVTNGTSTTCSTHTCATKAQGSTCFPFISSFDLSTYSICVLSGTSCVAGNANTFTSTLCFDKSVNTYTWNPTSQTCQACNQTVTNNTGNNNTNNTNNTYGYLLSILALIAFMI